MRPFQSRGCDGSPSSLPCHAGRIIVVDTWARSPLTMSGALHDMDGKKAEAPSTPRTVPGVDYEWPLQFSPWYK
jgi:hypothetical protein